MAGTARRGGARQGRAWLGTGWPGEAGKARRGEARPGEAGPGEAGMELRVNGDAQQFETVKTHWRCSMATKKTATKAKSKAKDAAKFEVPAIDVRVIKLWVRGVTPYICHRFGAKIVRQIEDKQQGKAKNKKAPRDPQAEFLDSLYELGKNKYGIPCSGIKKAMTGACRYVDGLPMTVVRGALHVLGDYAEIMAAPKSKKYAQPIMRTDNVRLPNKSGDVRYRGEFNPWAAHLSIRYNANAITPERIIHLVNTAGFGVGVGEWRPERDGSFGQFEVVEG